MTSAHAIWTTAWAKAADEVAARREVRGTRRAARASHTDLERDLAAFRTPSEIDDVLATLAPHDGPEVEEMRSILAANRRRFRAA